LLRLITTFYHEKHTNRRNEFLQAIRLNSENVLISNIYVLCESGEEFIADLGVKVEIIKQEKRPNFHELITFANSLDVSGIKIIANTDIYFDETLSKSFELKNKEVYCLTRWNQLNSGQIEFFPNFKSQDSWIFKGMLPDNIGDYFMGVPGCDNRLAAELVANGFNIYNPCLSVRSIHLHATEKRTYHKLLDRVPGDYAYCLPTFLDGDTKTKSLKKLYLLVRRKYYSSIYNKNLEGVELVIIDRIKAFMYLNYYKFRIKLI
jgi:hypothetical protein